MSQKEYFNQRFKELVNQTNKIGFYNSTGDEEELQRCSELIKSTRPKGFIDDFRLYLLGKK